VGQVPDAFRTISEVAAQLETPAHVLRFWESKFPQIKPVKRAGGGATTARRHRLGGGIKVLLHDQGMTIRGSRTPAGGREHVATLSPACIELPRRRQRRGRARRAPRKRPTGGWRPIPWSSLAGAGGRGRPAEGRLPQRAEPPDACRDLRRGVARLRRQPMHGAGAVRRALGRRWPRRPRASTSGRGSALGSAPGLARRNPRAAG
jgi:hypothetical protein